MKSVFSFIVSRCQLAIVDIDESVLLQTGKDVPTFTFFTHMYVLMEEDDGGGHLCENSWNGCGSVLLYFLKDVYSFIAEHDGSRNLHV